MNPDLQNAISGIRLDHSSLDRLWEFRHEILDANQSRLLSIAVEKIKCFPHLFGRSSQQYDATVGLVLMSNWKRALDFTTCMYKSKRIELGVMHKRRPMLNCGYWRLCPHDAWRCKMDLVARFLPKFSEGKWIFITMSFEGDFPLTQYNPRAFNPAITHTDVTTYWQANRYVIEEMIKNGTFRGAVLVDEFHLDGLIPVPYGIPHSHVVALVEKIPTPTQISHMETLLCQFQGRVIDLDLGRYQNEWSIYRSKLAKYRNGFLNTKPRTPPPRFVIDPLHTVDLPPSLDFIEIATEADFAKILSYLIKPMNLSEAYRKERHIVLRERPEALELLIQSVEDCLGACDHLLVPRRRLMLGECDPRSRSKYIGIPGRRLKDKFYREQINEYLLKIQKTEENDSCDEF